MSGKVSTSISVDGRGPAEAVRQHRGSREGTRLEKDAPRPGRIPSIPATKIRGIIEATLHTMPPATTHWSTRTMAHAHGVSEATVRRIWKQHNLKPHLVKPFKLSQDTQFLAKLTDVVGLYLNPPDKALVLCVDENSHIQVLDRTQPGLPIKQGRCGTRTLDDKRHGTATLFAALSMLDGTVIGIRNSSVSSRRLTAKRLPISGCICSWIITGLTSLRA